MKKLLILMIPILLLCGCTNTNDSIKVDYKKITASEAKAIIDKDSNVIILDVRTQEEFEAGHIKNAVLLPDTEIASKAQNILPDKNKKILVYCRSGRRSEIASKELIKLGYKNVFDFGGINDWKYELVK